MRNTYLRFCSDIVFISLVFVSEFFLFSYFFRDATVPVMRILYITGGLGLFFVLANMMLVCRQARWLQHDFAAEQNDPGKYAASLKSMGAVPLKVFCSVAVNLLAYIILGLGVDLVLGAQRSQLLPRFGFFFSIAMLNGTILFVLADILVAKVLQEQELVMYPSALRENRQQLKGLIIPTGLVVLSLIFAISLTYLVFAINDSADASRRINTWGLIIAATLVFFAFCETQLFLWSRSNGKIYQKIISQMEQLTSAEKDLGRRISICSVDEFATIAGMVNHFCGTLKQNMIEIKKSQTLLTAYGTDLDENASLSVAAVLQISANIERVKEKTQSQSASAVESSSAVEQISKNIESLDRLIGNQAASVTESSAAIEQMVGNIGSINTSIEKMATEFKDLSEAAREGNRSQEITGERISKITERSEALQEANQVIAKIASQTNLLAMNAAIEAAHAGNAGRGFSVVADEIRHLAETSAKESKNIKNALTQVKSAITDVVAASEASGTSYSRVTERINSTEELVRLIQQAMAEQQEGIKQLMEALREMNEITSQVRTGSQEMSAGSAMVLDEMGRLQASSMEIKENMDEMAAGSTEIADGTRKVSEIAEGTRATITHMGKTVEVFKTEG